jgi:hypothetical protein
MSNALEYQGYASTAGFTVDRLGAGVSAVLRDAGPDMRAPLVLGDKRKQSNDLDYAVDYLKDYKERSNKP